MHEEDFKGWFTFMQITSRPYHTMDPSQAIERILEAKGMLTDEKEELERQYEIFKRIRNGQ